MGKKSFKYVHVLDKLKVDHEHVVTIDITCGYQKLVFDYH